MLRDILMTAHPPLLTRRGMCRVRHTVPHGGGAYSPDSHTSSICRNFGDSMNGRCGYAILVSIACMTIASGCQKELGQQAKPPVIRIAQTQDRLLNPLTEEIKKTLREHYPAEVVTVTP